MRMNENGKKRQAEYCNTINLLHMKSNCICLYIAHIFHFFFLSLSLPPSFSLVVVVVIVFYCSGVEIISVFILGLRQSAHVYFIQLFHRFDGFECVTFSVCRYSYSSLLFFLLFFCRFHIRAYAVEVTMPINTTTNIEFYFAGLVCRAH